MNDIAGLSPDRGRLDVDAFGGTDADEERKGFSGFMGHAVVTGKPPASSRWPVRSDSA